MKTQFGMAMLALALMCAMASGTFAQTRNGPRTGPAQVARRMAKRIFLPHGTGGKAQSDKMNGGATPK